jgi:hypothetical protein
MKFTAMLFAFLLFWGLQAKADETTVDVTQAEKEVVAQELQKEASSGKHDSQTQKFLQKISLAFESAKENIEVEVDKLKQDCADCSREQKTKNFLTTLGRKLGKGAAWLSTTTARPFMSASSFVKGAVEKGDKNKDLVALYKFFLNHQEEFDQLYLEAGTPDEMVDLMLARMEEIMQKKSNLIMRDFLVHFGITREIPQDLSKFELTEEEMATIDESKIDPEFIHNHPEYMELRPLIGDMTKNEVTDLITSGYFNKAISFEKYKTAVPTAPELVGTIVGQLFAPKIALGIISKSLAGLYMTPVMAADIGTGVSTAICLQKETQEQFANDKDLKMFCSYVTNKSGYELMKSRARGYVAGKKFHEKMADKIKKYKEKREERKRQKELKNLELG